MKYFILYHITFKNKKTQYCCFHLIPIDTYVQCGGSGLVAKLCLTLTTPMDCNLPASVPGISQAWILEWVAISSSRGSSWPRDWAQVSCIGRQILLPGKSTFNSKQNSSSFTLGGNWQAHSKMHVTQTMNTRKGDNERTNLKHCFIGIRQFSRSVVSDSLWPHEPQHARPPCPSPTPRVHPNPMSIESVSPSPPAFNLSQYQGLFQWISSLHQVAKVLEFQLQHQSFQWIIRTDVL